MTGATRPRRWRPRIEQRDGPAYRAIADALEADVRAGRLLPGDPLPTQRELADALGLNFTTVTRGYTEARRRGLITATVGRGTFVANRLTLGPPGSAEPASGGHDLTVNTPPVPQWLAATFHATLANLASDAALARRVLRYELGQDDGGARDAGTKWLQARGLDATPKRVVLTAGAQHALSLMFTVGARPGDTVLTEALAYPSLLAMAAAAGIKLVGVDIDDQGLRPEALDDACAALRPRMLFCVPTLHSPTAAVMSLERRHQLIAVARRHRLRIVEDDIHGPLLPPPAPPPLAALAPDLVTYVGCLSKCVAPGLRVAFVLMGSVEEAAQLDMAVRTSLLMLSPLPVAVASAWVLDGTAERAVIDIRRAASARVKLATDILGAERLAAPAGSLHVWMQLPPSWTVAAFVALSHQRGVRVAPADWYVTPRVGPPAPVPSAVRLSLGGDVDPTDLEVALRILASILHQPAVLRTSNP